MHSEPVQIQSSSSPIPIPILIPSLQQQQQQEPLPLPLPLPPPQSQQQPLHQPHLPLINSSSPLACSSQHILATPFYQPISLKNSFSILFSLFPVPNRQTPQWLFTLPPPPSIPYLPHPSSSTSTSTSSSQSSSSPLVDLLLFSPDGTHLLISSHTASSLNQPSHLRLSILIQDSSKADQWRLGWDELVCGPQSPPHLNSHPINLLDPHSKKVLSARFLSDSRRWFTEPVTPEISIPEDDITTIRSVKYRKLKRTQPRAINGFVQGKGQTAILVLNTNQLFVVHMPLPQSNLPPHVLLTTLSHSTLAATPLRLAPTPSSLAGNKQQPVVDNSSRSNKPPESQATPAEPTLKPQDPATHNLGLGFSLNSPSFPVMNNAGPLFESNLAPPVQDALGGFGLNGLFGTQDMTAKKAGGSSRDPFDPNGPSQFDELLHGFTQTRKEVRLAAIGLPCERREAEEDDPRVLVAFQSTMKPIVPTPVVHRTVGGLIGENDKVHVHPGEAHQIGGSQISMAEEDIGDYITGLGDLDDAFDAPLDRTFSASGNENNSDGGAKAMAKQMASEEGKMDEEVVVGVGPGKRKGAGDGRMQKMKRRRYEPVVGIDESALGGAGAGDWTGYGFIEVAEVFVDFEESVVPTITIQHLPNLPIVDPFDHNESSRILPKTLDFLETDLESPSVSRAPQIRLLATYSKEVCSDEGSDGGGGGGSASRGRGGVVVVDEMQSWEARFEGGVLSSGFLGLECSGSNNGSSTGQVNNKGSIGGGKRHAVNNLDSLQGPEEWVISRSSKKRLVVECNDGSGNKMTRKLRVCKIVPFWRPRSGSFLAIVSKEKEVKKRSDDGDGDANGDEVQFECLVLNMRDLAEIGSRELPVLLAEREIKRLIVTYHGAWGCLVDERGRVRALALIGPEQKDMIVGLVMSAIYNREPVDDLSRLLGSSGSTSGTYFNHDQSTTGEEEAKEAEEIKKPKFDHEYIFAQISSFIASLTVSFKNYDFDPLLGCGWNVGYELWSASPGYKEAAELALAARQLCVAVTIGISVKQEAYSRSLWQIIGYARWYSRLCQRIISSVEPDSERPYLSLLATTSCTFYYLFKFAMVINSFQHWLAIMHSANSVTGTNNGTSGRGTLMPSVGCADGRLSRELELAKGTFSALWENENPVAMDHWGRLLQELGPGVIPKPGTDLSKLPKRQVESFSGPLAACDSAQVKESVLQLRRMIGRYPELVKPGSRLLKSGFIEERVRFDVLTGIRVDVGDGGNRNGVRECAKCRARVGEFGWRREASSMTRMAKVVVDGKNRVETGTGTGIEVDGLGELFEKEGPGPFECAIGEYYRRCICAGVWVSGEPDGGSGKFGGGKVSGEVSGGKRKKR